MAASSSSRVYVSLGSNAGDSVELLAEARRALALIPQTSIDAISSLYHTQPQDDPHQPWFWNQVLRLQTSLSPQQLLEATQGIETALGRRREMERRFGPRPIDIDLLLFGTMEIHSESLRIPHPRLTHRAFVLIPLLELDPQLTLPDGTTLQAVLACLSYTSIGCRIWQPAKETT